MKKDKQTEEKIFEAAKEVFAERGMEGARMQEIADRAGINKSLLHYYFRTKEKLFSAVFDDLAEMIFMKFAQIFSRELPFEEKIKHFFSEHIDFLKANPGLPLFILSEINRSPDRMKKLTEKINYNSLWETALKDITSGSLVYQNRNMHINPADIPQLVTTAISITVFPFAARNLISPILEKNGVSFDTYLEERKDFAVRFVIGFLTSNNNLYQNEM